MQQSGNAPRPPRSSDLSDVRTQLDELREQMTKQHEVLATRLPQMRAADLRVDPVYLQFDLRDSNDFNTDEVYVVPEGSKLRIEFVGVRTSGHTFSRGMVRNSVALEIEFPNGEGAICSRPNREGLCRLVIPVTPLNNSDVGANVSFGFPSTGGPVALEVPAGGRVSSRVSSSFGGPDTDKLRAIHVTAAGQLIELP